MDLSGVFEGIFLEFFETLKIAEAIKAQKILETNKAIEKAFKTLNILENKAINLG